MKQISNDSGEVVGAVVRRCPSLPRGRSILAWGLGLVFLPGCGAHMAGGRGLPALREPTRLNCLVLSVGGPDGVAHLGAIRALRDARVPIGCVVGNSMGAVVGALYASAPGADTTQRYRAFAGDYVAAAHAEASDSGGLLGALGAVVGLATGGVGWAVAGALGGYAAGASSVRPADHQRLVRVLDRTLQRAQIEALPLPFVTMYQVPGGRMMVERRGPTAAAVGASAANPFVFQHLDVRTMRQLDPGLDRLARVPSDQACIEHPGARLIVINVTEGEPLLTNGHACEIVHVRVRVTPMTPQAALQLGPEFDRAVEEGRVATQAALDGYSSP
jgi:predicted acylesterase/phospholipase RssA